MNLENRISWLQEEHARLNRQIDDITKHTVPDQDAIHNLKKKRLQIKDELVTLQKQFHEQIHERADWDE